MKKSFQNHEYSKTEFHMFPQVLAFVSPAGVLSVTVQRYPSSLYSLSLSLSF